MTESPFLCLEAVLPYLTHIYHEGFIQHIKGPKLLPINKQSVLAGGKVRPKLAGFAKVLAGGRVVKLDNTKTFDERFLGCAVQGNKSSAQNYHPIRLSWRQS